MQHFTPIGMSVSQIQEHVPSSGLVDFVRSYWTGNFNTGSALDFTRSVVPNGYVELIIHLNDDHCELYKDHGWNSSPDFTVLGIYTRPYTVKFRKNVQVFGIRFNPEGFNIAFGVPPSEFLESFEDMESIAGRAFGDYCQRLRECGSVSERIDLTEKFLRRNLSNTSGTYDYVRNAAILIRKNRLMRMTDLYEMIPISPRQLQREFKSRIGVSPKAYMRLARMNAIQQYLNVRDSADLTALTYDHGFSDQSHFIKEFRALTGAGPGRFLKQRERFLVAFDSAQAPDGA